MFCEDDDSKEEKTDYIKLKIEIRHLLKDDFNRQVLAEILLDLRKDVTGDTQRRLFNLYKNLELHKDAYQKLKSWKWHVVSKGILELTQMQVEESYNLITKFINDKRVTIRKQAEIATVSLKHEGINFFLDTTRYRISEWQQLKLLDVIRNLEDFQPPRFKVWLTSSNRHVVLFALRLIKYYNQNDVKPSLIELAKHKNNKIKDEAINCIKEFNVSEALDTLQTVFWKSTPHIKISILDTIAAIGNEDNVEFLQLIEKKEANFSVRSKAISAINTILPESILPTKGIQDVSNFEIPDDVTRKEEFDELWPSEPELPIFEQDIHEENILRLEPKVEHNTTTDIERQKGDVPNVKNIEETDESVSLNLQPEFEIDIVEDTIDERNDPKIMEEEHFSEMDEKNKEIEPAYIPSEEDTDFQGIDLQFLPIVIDAEMEEEHKETVKSKKHITSESPERHLHEIEVIFEQVLLEDLTLEEEAIESIDGLAMTEISFLPIVVDEDDMDTNISEESRYRYSIPEKNPENKASDNANLAFEQVFQKEAIDRRLLSKKNKKAKLPVSTAEIDKAQVRQITVVFEQLIPEKDRPDEMVMDNENEKMGDGLKDLEFDIPMNKTAINEDRPIQEDPREQKSTKKFLKYIPEIELYEQDTLEKLELLDDIEELGDEREIPLLLEYLDDENVPVVRERIQEILKKFSPLEIQKLSTSGNKSRTEDLTEHTSVVADFFEHCDTESKLILLDTLTDIMDQKDIRFLEELLESPDLEIRKKAQSLLHDWQEQQTIEESINSKKENVIDGNTSSVVSHESDEGYDFLLDELEIRKSDTYDIFDIEFEVGLDEEEHEHEGGQAIAGPASTSEKALLSRLKFLPTKIFERLNG